MKTFFKKFWVELIHDKRIKAMMWQTSMMLAGWSVDFMIANVNDLPMNPIVATGLGLVLINVSKAIHNAVTKERPV